MDVQRWLSSAVAAIEDWQDGFEPFQRDPSMQVSDDRFASVFGEFTQRMRNNYRTSTRRTPARCSSPRTRRPSSAT